MRTTISSLVPRLLLANSFLPRVGMRPFHASFVSLKNSPSVVIHVHKLNIISDDRGIPFLDACGVNVQCNGVSGVGQFSTLCVNFKSSIFVCEVSMELAVTLLEDTVSVCRVGGGVGEMCECIWRMRVRGGCVSSEGV